MTACRWSCACFEAVMYWTRQNDKIVHSCASVISVYRITFVRRLSNLTASVCHFFCEILQLSTFNLRSGSTHTFSLRRPALNPRVLMQHIHVPERENVSELCKVKKKKTLSFSIFSGTHLLDVLSVCKTSVIGPMIRYSWPSFKASPALQLAWERNTLLSFFFKSASDPAWTNGHSHIRA